MTIYITEIEMGRTISDAERNDIHLFLKPLINMGVTDGIATRVEDRITIREWTTEQAAKDWVAKIAEYNPSSATIKLKA